jgi:hypothetical protein
MGIGRVCESMDWPAGDWDCTVAGESVDAEAGAVLGSTSPWGLSIGRVVGIASERGRRMVEYS